MKVSHTMKYVLQMRNIGSIIELDEKNTEYHCGVFAFNKPIEIEKVRAVEINGAVFDVPYEKIAEIEP